MNLLKIARDVLIVCTITLLILVVAEIGLRLIFHNKITVSPLVKLPEVAYTFNKNYLSTKLLI